MPQVSRRALLTLDVDRAAPDESWLRVHRTAMACRFEVTLPRGDARHIGAARSALDEAGRIEAALSVFRESSELSRINRRAAAEPAPASGELFALLTRCQAFHSATDGAFDVTSTPLSRCWGFLKREGRVPPIADIDAALRSVGMDRVRLDLTSRTVRFAEPGMELNLGGIGKGYALDRLGQCLRRDGVSRALVSAGGSSVLAIGGSGQGWTIEVSSPRRERRIARLRLRDGALGTSGAGEQFFVSGAADGTRYGHVIDPRTGWPAQGVLSASVVTREAETADALSTAFLIGGVPLADRYCQSHSGVLAFITLDDPTERTRVFGGYAGAQLEH
jgi:thiamine biosynthesis lipoprotein